MKLFLLDQTKYIDDNELYFIKYFETKDSSINSDMGDAALDKMFRTSLLEAARAIDGDLESERVISLQGYRGREGVIHFSEGEHTFCMRMILVHRRVFVLVVTCPSAKANNSDAEKFFNSFSVSAENSSHP